MRHNAARTFYTIAFGLLLLVSASGQSNSAAPVSANENYELNIGESRVVESNYERSTSVELSTDRRKASVTVRVGAAVFAEKIEIVLRGVTGNVRFRASLDALRRRIERPTEPLINSTNR